jgi:hypothetical protein
LLLSQLYLGRWYQRVVFDWVFFSHSCPEPFFCGHCERNDSRKREKEKNSGKDKRIKQNTQ